MNKKLIKDIKEYRIWAWDLIETHSKNNEVCTIEKTLGMRLNHECWDYNEAGQPIEEDGSIIPEDTIYTVKLDDWVYDLKFPVVAVYFFESGFDRTGDYEISFCDFVSSEDFRDSH